MALLDEALEAENASPLLRSFFSSILQQESSGRLENVPTSNRGAAGPSQIIPGTFQQVADPGWDISNPYYNLRAGIRYAQLALDASENNPELAGAYYYGGPGGLEKAKKGIAVSDPRNPKAPNTLQYGQQVAQRMGEGSEAGEIASMNSLLKSIKGPKLRAEPTGDEKIDGLLKWAQEREDQSIIQFEKAEPQKVAEQAGEEVRERTTAQKAGRLATTVGGGLLGTIGGGMIGHPVIGGALGAAGGSALAETFDPSASPAKEALFEAGSSLAGGAVGKIFGKIISPGAVREGGEELLQRSIQRGLRPPLPSQYFESKTLQMLQNVGESSFVAAGTLQEAKDVAIRTTRGAAEQYTRRIAAQRVAGARLMEQVSNEANLSGVRVQLAPIRNAVDALANKYTSNTELRELSRRLHGIRDTTVPFYVADEELIILQGMARPGTRLNVIGAQNIASELKRATRDMRDVSDIRAVSSVVGHVEDGMQQALAHSPQLTRRWQVGRAAYRRGVQGEEIQDLLNKSIVTGGEAGVVGGAAGEIGGTKLMNNLKPQVLERLSTELDPQQIRNLKTFARSLEAAEGGGSKALSFVSNGIQISAVIKIAGQAAQAISIGGAAAGAAMTGGLTAPVLGAVALSLTPTMIAKIMASPAVMQTMLKLSRLPENSKVVGQLSNQLIAQLLRESILTENEVPVQQPTQ